MNIQDIDYKSQFRESISDNANDLAIEIENTIKKIFPKSAVKAEFNSRMYPSITVWFTLGKDKSEYINGIEQNDIAHMRLTIDGKGQEIGKDGEIKGLLQVENSSPSFRIKSESPYMAFGRMKVPFRKASGSSEKIVEYIKKYFITFKKALQDNKDKIPDNDLKLIGDKF